MKTLILKLDATGDVVRTTTLLHRLGGDVRWITAARNVSLLEGVWPGLRVTRWEDRREALAGPYDLVVSLEDDLEVARFVGEVAADRVFGSYVAADGRVAYTEDSRGWFDLSLVSTYGRQRADELKLVNRRSYQELVFEGLGWAFAGESYVLPQPVATELRGDVAIAPVAGPVWPMKGWEHYGDLERELTRQGYIVNVLPHRATLLEHMGDVRNHRCLVCGDSLPMHLALGLGVRCVALFNCTSPWEIHDYGLLTKIVSPLIEQFFYKRGMDRRATTAIGLDTVLETTLESLQRGAHRD
jgi:heptosyltransferase-2